MDNGKCGYLGYIHGWFAALRGLGSHMVDLGCQDKDWIDGGRRDVLDAILLWNGPVLATLGMDKGKFAYLRYISGWFSSLRGAPRVTDGGFRVSEYRVVR